MAARPAVVSVVGPSGSGKTTLIEAMVPRLRAAGLRVGTVKHAPHGYDVDLPGKDSWRHRAAGADAVLLAGRSGAVVFLGPPEAHGAHRHSDRDHEEKGHWEPGPLIRRHLGHVDLVLVEGFAADGCDLLIAVERPGTESEPLHGVEVWATVANVMEAPVGVGSVRILPPEDIDALVGRLIVALGLNDRGDGGAPRG